jgi:diacylglycerol kinase (ATP)
MHERGTGTDAATREPDAGAGAGADGAMPAARPLAIIHNPIAGRRRGRLLARVVAALGAVGHPPRVVATAARGDAARIARELAGAGAATGAVAGGDGTINEAVNGLAGTGARLAIVPLGTANVLAGELGLPRDAAAIARVIAGGAARPIHLGEVAAGAGRRRFTMMAGVGFDAHVVANLSLALKRRTGKLAYAWQMLVEWLRLRPARFRVTADGAAFDCASAIVAKGRFYAGRYVAAPDASLARDSFELVLFERGGRLAVLRYALALGLGRLARTRGVRILTARAIAIEGGGPVHADGDIVGTLPARFAIARETLHVLVPANW